MKNKSIIAIELGSTKVACAIGQPRAERSFALGYSAGGPSFDLLGCGLASYPTLASTWLGDVAAMTPAIEEALDAAEVASTGGRAVVALTHPALTHVRVKAQIDVSDEPAPIRTRELQRLNDQAIAQALGIDRDVLLLEPLGYTGNGFHGVRNPRGLSATRLGGTFHLVTIPLSIRRAVTQALEAAGLELVQLRYSLQTIPTAGGDGTGAGAAAASARRFLVVDIGGACIDVGILDAGRVIRSATIPVGGLTIMEAIAKECRLTMEQALPLSLQGLSSSNAVVKRLLEEVLQRLQRELRELLKDEILPERAIVSGRGALMDGLVEWVEQVTDIHATLGRSPHAKPLGDLTRQLAMSQALSLLESACERPVQPPERSGPVLNRLLAHTKRLLVEYF